MELIKRTAARNDRVVKGDTVVVSHFTTHDTVDRDTGYQHVTTLDFSKCSKTQLLELAADAAIIAARQKYGFKTLPIESVPTTIDVSTMMTRRSKVTGVSKTLATLAKQTGKSVEELAAMLQDLS